MIKYIPLIFILFVSCKVFKPSPPPINNRLVVLTNQQLTDSVTRQGNDIRGIKSGFVYIDTNFFKITANGTLTFKSNIKFDTVKVLKRLEIGAFDTTNHGGTDTLIVDPNQRPAPLKSVITDLEFNQIIQDAITVRRILEAEIDRLYREIERLKKIK